MFKKLLILSLMTLTTITHSKAAYQEDTATKIEIVAAYQEDIATKIEIVEEANHIVDVVDSLQRVEKVFFFQNADKIKEDFPIDPNDPEYDPEFNPQHVYIEMGGLIVSRELSAVSLAASGLAQSLISEENANPFAASNDTTLAYMHHNIAKALIKVETELEQCQKGEVEAVFIQGFCDFANSPLIDKEFSLRSNEITNLKTAIESIKSTVVKIKELISER